MEDKLAKLEQVLTPYLDSLDLQKLSKHNKSYLHYNEDRFARFVRDEWPYHCRIYEWYKANAKPGSHILEVGCFIPVIPLLLTWEGFKVTTIEKLSLYDGALDGLEKILQENQVDFINDDILEYDFKDKYDYVNLLAVVEHLNGSPQVLLAKLQKLVADSQGKFLFVVPNHARLANRLKLLLGASAHPSFADYWESAYPFTGHNREYTFAESKYALERSGFKLEDMRGINYQAGLSMKGLLNGVSHILPNTFSHAVFAVACAD